MILQQSEARRERLREEKAEAQRLGVKVTKRVVIDKGWTDAEDETVRRLFPDYEAMINVLRHRSYSSLKWRASLLGLVTRRHIWTQVENRRLTDLWSGSTSEELKLAFPGLSYPVIVKHGYFLGLSKRGKTPLIMTGNWLNDAIRDRCRVLGYSMGQLDEMARTGEYFEKAAWRRKPGHLWRPMVQAAKVLGGELRVEWPD